MEVLDIPLNDKGCIVSYRDNTFKFKVKCKICGHEWQATSMQLLVDKKSCPACMRKVLGEKRSKRIKSLPRKYTAAQINEKLKKKGFEVTPESYHGRINSLCKFRCIDCGYEFEKNLSRLWSRNYKCPVCKSSSSTGEKMIKKFLDENNINYKAEYRFSDCKDKKPLPFDFYLLDYNCCIEYQGCQHYDENQYNKLVRNTNRNGGFTAYQKRDQIKRDYCQNKGILYIEVFDYEKIDDIELKIKEKLNLK